MPRTGFSFQFFFFFQFSVQFFSCRHVQGRNWSICQSAVYPSPQQRWDHGASNGASLEFMVCPQPFSAPPTCSFCLQFQLGTLNQLERKHKWLLIKSQTVLSYIAPVGLGSRKERARLDRSCIYFLFFLFFYQWGWGYEGWPGVGRRVHWRPVGRGGWEGGEISK